MGVALNHAQGPPPAEFLDCLQVYPGRRRAVKRRCAAGKRAEADEHFATAISMYREMGMTYWLEKAETEARELA